MRVLAVSNQKGGTGKSTTALTVGAGLARLGRRVLLVDLDPQASMTAWLGIDAAGASMAEVLGGAQPGRLQLQAITKTHDTRLDIAPGDIALSNCELGLVSRLGREAVLKKTLATVAGKYDVAVLDCPPALGLLTVTALVAADAVIAPVLPAAADLRGLQLFLGTLSQIREDLNPGLQLLGVVVVQFDGRLTAHNQALEVLSAAGLHVLMPPIPRSVRVQESAATGQPLQEYDPDGKPAIAYQQITNEVDAWLRNQI